jgi:hypothetical protein
MLLILSLVLIAPLALLPPLLWLSWRLTRGRLGRRKALAVPVAILLLLGVSEAIPYHLAASIARDSASDRAGSVVADSILFPSAVSAAEALAVRPSLRFTEGHFSPPAQRGYEALPEGPIRFSGVRPLAPGASCGAGEVEEWLTGEGSPPPRRCVGWQAAAHYEATYEAFAPETVRRRIGPYAVREFASGLRRRADGRKFNVWKDVEVTGGLVWHLIHVWLRVTGLIGFGHPGYVDGTFSHIPRADYVAFRYRGALPDPAAAP